MLRFGLPMADRLDGTLHLSLEPELEGDWAWASDQELVFTPAPNSFPHGNRVQLVVDRAVPLAGEDKALTQPLSTTIATPYFQLESKVASWPVVADQPRFVGFLNLSSLELGAAPLLLIYDQPVDPAWVDRYLGIFSDGQPLARTVRAAPASVPWVYAGPLPGGHVIAVQLQHPPQDGSFVEVKAPDATGGRQDLVGWTLQVRERFQLEDVHFSYGSSERAALHERIQLTLSGPILRDQLEDALSIRPAPVEQRVSAWDNAISVDLTLEPGTDYTLTLDAALTDVLANTLGEPATLSFRSQDLPPVLQLPSLPLAAEAERGRLEIRGRNLGPLAVSAYPVTPDAFALGMERGPQPCVGAPVEVPAGSLSGAANEMGALELALGPQLRGLRCLEIRAEGTGSEGGEPLSGTALVQISNLGVTAKVSEGTITAWVTQLDQPSARSDVAVAILDRRGRVLAEGPTDADGLVTLEVDAARDHGVSEPLYVVAEDRTDTTIVPLRTDRLSAPWQFGLTGAVEGQRSVSAALFTERGAYRPGETAHLTVVGGPALGGATTRIRVSDPRGQEVLSQRLQLDAFGVGSVEVPSRASSAVGSYLASLSYDGGTLTHRYRVEEYRVPTFQVTVDGDADWALGRKVHSTLSASYLHGGTLDGRAVRWELTRVPEPFAAPGLPQFRFSRGPGALDRAVASGTGRLDGAGRLPVTFTPDHPSAAGPMRYTLEATVTDVDRQAWSGRASRVVHAAALYVGVQPPQRSVLRAGETLDVPTIAVDPSGSAVPGVSVRAELVRIDHHSTTRRTLSGTGQVSSRRVGKVVTSCRITTRKTPRDCALKIPSPGAYEIRATARDARGRTVETGFSVTAAGEGVAAWPRFDRERIEVVADKASYAPGDVARLVVQSPFRDATALLTLERDGVLEHRIVPIRGNTPAIEVPITEAHAPNVFASIAVLRGRIHDKADASGFETGAPAFRLGIVELDVELQQRRLDVQVRAGSGRAHPKDELPIELSVHDHAGAAVDGRAVVMVVDEAVLGLTGYRTPDPVPSLYPDAPLGVRTADSRLELAHARRARREVLFPGGDGAGELGALLPNAMLRNLFQSTALFDARVDVHDGRATVPLSLPDNTTTFRVMAVVVDAGGRAGSGQAPLVVNKPLMVQAVTPRFVYPGDELVIEALIHNGTEESAEAIVSSRLVGMDARERSGGSATVPAGGTATVSVPVVVSGDRVSVTFDAVMGRHADAIEVEVPVLEPGVARTQVVSQTVSGDATLSLTLPPDRVRGSEALEVVASTTALTELRDAVDYLMGYPNGCIEQTTSRAYPLVMLEDLLPEIGVEVDPVQLRTYAEAGVARILTFQTEEGGLSYWPGSDETHAFATAFGLTALIEAKDKGYDVPEADLSRMADYLEAALQRGDVTESIPHGGIADGDTRALFVMTLGRLDRPQPAWIEQLWSSRDKLTPFGLSFLGIAAAEMQPPHPLLPQLLASVEATAVQDRDQAWYEGESRGGYSMDSPLRSHASALLAYAQGAPGHALSPKLLAGLLQRRRGGLWGNTQENVFGIMGVHALAVHARGGGAAPGVRLARNGAPIDAAAMEAVSERVRRFAWGPEALSGDAQQLTVGFSGGPPVNVRLRASYDLQLTDANRAPVESGMVVTRRYEAPDGTPLDPARIPLGSLVRVVLTLETTEPLNYVALDDKLPAGLEPLNTALQTTESVSLGPPNAATNRLLAQLSYSEVRDHRVAFFADALPAGTYEARYVARATSAGTFLRPSARGEAMYRPEIFGTTAIDRITIQ